MRKFLKLLLLSFLLTNIAKAGEKEDITALVYKWNELHNTRETSVFKDIYASSVLFYGKYRSRETCFKNKQTFLSTDFNQEIISPVKLTYYSSGTVKCSFRKKVTYKNLVKKHDCYLLMKQENGQWHISAESDLVTDKNLNVQLDLGEELVSTGINKLPFITVGVSLLALIGFFVYRRKQKTERNKVFMESVAETVYDKPLETNSNEPVFETEKIVATVKEAVLKEIKTVVKDESLQDSESEKGIAFEKYVVERFNPEYFELKEWRSDKYHEGVYASSNQLPDLEYHFRTQSQFAKFAVECKWRAEFFKGRIEWAKGYQLSKYRDYERKSRITVFVIIGLGGTPESPQSVYLIPLRQIRSNVLTEQQLKPYYRHRQGNFYLNVGHNFMALD
jgi:LPXTG-motif cell wall-anchored protein